MAITILPPAPPTTEYDSDASDNGGFDSEGDVDMVESGRPAKRARTSAKGIVTPGETVTDDPQWMRYAITRKVTFYWLMFYIQRSRNLHYT